MDRSGQGEVGLKKTWMGSLPVLGILQATIHPDHNTLL